MIQARLTGPEFRLIASRIRNDMHVSTTQIKQLVYEVNASNLLCQLLLEALLDEAARHGVEGSRPMESTKIALEAFLTNRQQALADIDNEAPRPLR